MTVQLHVPYREIYIKEIKIKKFNKIRRILSTGQFSVLTLNWVYIELNIAIQDGKPSSKI